MRNSGPLVGFLLAPLVGALFLTVWGIMSLVGRPQGIGETGAVLAIVYAVFCYGAALSLGVPLYFAFKRLRLMHPMLYPVGGALLGFLFGFAILRTGYGPWRVATVSGRFPDLIACAIAGTLSGLSFRLALGADNSSWTRRSRKPNR